MNNFTDQVASSVDSAKAFIYENIKNPGTLLTIIAIVGIFMFNSYMVSLWCAGLYLITIVDKYFKTKTSAIRIAAFDPDTPDILKKLINDSIAEYAIYTFGFQKNLYIKDSMEVTMNYGVSDIVITKLQNSALNDKLILYYGDGFDHILVTQVNMAVANFVIETNNRDVTPPTKGTTPVHAGTVDISSMLKNIGIEVK